MKTTLLLLIITCNMLYSYTYDQKLLQIDAKIAPRILYMIAANNPLPATRLCVAIVYEKGDAKAARELCRYIDLAYPEGMGDKTLNIEMISYASFEKVPENTLIFLLDAPDSKIARVLAYAQKNRLLTMSYHERYLKKGVLISLHIGKTLKPYLNILAAKESDIIFSSTLISVSKIYKPRRHYE